MAITPELVMNENLLAAIGSELERRRNILIGLAHNAACPLDHFERTRIRSVLERSEAPERPADIATLLKQFCVSSFSYALLRNFLKACVGEMPSRANIANALARVFGNDSFFDERIWTPGGLEQLARAIQNSQGYDLSSHQFKPRIVSVLLTGSKKLSTELREGLQSFYSRIGRITHQEQMWKFATDFCRPISQVGPALICDFFKELGFTRYVKVDHHFRKEFPQLLRLDACSSLSPRRSFMLSQEIADAVGISPYHLDAILYFWGRYGRSLPVREKGI